MLNNMQKVEKDFVWSHGSGGFFGGLCLDKGGTSAIPLPRGGLIDFLPRTNGSITREAEHAIYTGVTAETVSAAATACDDPRFTAGDLKLGILRTGFGNMSIKTDLIDIKAGGMMEGCEVSPPVLMQGGGISDSNYWTPSMGSVGGPSVNFSDPGNKALYELYAGLVRVMSPTTFSGDGVAVDPTYTPMVGFDNLISDTLVDAETSAALPRAYSHIVDFAGADVTTTPATTVTTITSFYNTLVHRAEIFGLAPARFALVMRAGLFFEVSAIWPCAYATNRCSTADVDGFMQVAMRDEMRAGKFLWINGEKVTVITDETIPVNAVPDPDTSTIYGVPLTIQGNRAATAVDYFNWNSPLGLGSPTMRRLVGNSESYSVIDNGRFLIIRNPMTNGCTTVNIYTKPRILLFTPQIAGRIINVGFAYNEFENVEWDPAAAGFVNGGVVSR